MGMWRRVCGVTSALGVAWALAVHPAPCAADVVSHSALAALGQQNLVYNILNQTASDVVFYPHDVARDPSQAKTRLVVADTFNSRVLGFECPGTNCLLSTGASAVRVFGQPDLSSWASNGGVGSQPGASTLSFPRGVAMTAAGALVVADTGNNRVLVYQNPWSDAVADVVLGQDSMSGVAAGSGLNRLRSPEGVAVDATGAVWVADTGNNRVVRFTSVQNGATASLALGGGGGPSATTMSGPRGLSFAPSGELYVADTGFSRVLRFRAGVTNAEAAQAVYGQGGNLGSGTANLGGLSASSLGFPEKVFLDAAGRLWVADTGNNRVLEYDTPLSNATAQRVYGQSSRTQVPTFATNVIDAPDGFPNASGMAGPRGFVIDGAQVLWVADRDNSRLVGFENPLGSAPANIVADRVLGDTQFVDSAANGASDRRLNNPFGLALDSSTTPNRLWVVDVGNNRVLGFDSTADITNDRPADAVLGQASFDASATNAGINGPLQNAANSVASATSLFFPSGVAVDSLGGVYVADTSNSRVVHFANPLGSDTTADRVFGQDNFSDRNPDYQYGTGKSLAGPRHVATDGSNNLWVADTLYHRVVRFSNAPAQPTTGATADLVIGQSGFVSSTTFPPASYTSGCAANKMNQPYGVHVGKSGRLYVVDTLNNRVLVFSPPFSNGMSAAAVIGQANLTSCAPNRGGAPGASTLKQPWRVFEDASGNVWVADYGNNRVLLYYTPFPSGDLVADEVLGQPDFSTTSVAGQPGPLTLSGAADVAVDSGGRVFVADSENSRVTRYGTGAATVVLDPLSQPVVAGGFLTVTGSGFTNGSVVKLFVAGISGVEARGPYVPQTKSPGFLITNLPPDIPLGNGFVTVQVINTDQGYAASNTQSHWLFGSASFGIPTVTSLNGAPLPAPDPSVPVAYVKTNVVQGSTVTIVGTGFQSPLVNLYTAAGNVGPLTPLAGGSSTQLQVVVPPGAVTGPGSFQVVNAPYSGNVQSNAVSVPIGQLLSISKVTQNGNTVTVDGTGLSSLSVINLFNNQGANVVNLGGLNPDGSPRVPTVFVNDTRITFSVPPGAVTGPAFVEVLNPPFIPYSSSGNDPDGAFALTAAAPIATSEAASVAGRGHVDAEASVAPPFDASWRGAPGERDVAGRDSEGEFVTWTHLVGAATDGETLWTLGEGREAAGASSMQALVEAAGAVSWAIPDGGGDVIVGLSHGDGDALPSDVDFGLRAEAATGELVVYEGGTRVGALGAFEAGDALRVSVDGLTVGYWHNEALRWESTRVPTLPLVVDVSLAGGDARLGPVTLAGAHGTQVAWLPATEVEVRGSWAQAASATGLASRDVVTSGAVAAELLGPAGVGFGLRACEYCVWQVGTEVEVRHAGAARGRWPAAPDGRYRVELDGAAGVVRYWAGATRLLEAPLDGMTALGVHGWLGSSDAAIANVVLVGATRP